MVVLYRRLMRSIANYGLRVAVRRSWERLLRSLRNHGVLGTLARVNRNPNASIVVEHPVHPFDLRHGTDTSGFIPGARLLADVNTGTFAVAYWGIAPSVLPKALALVPIDPRRFTFVDLGCGKGRALLLAAQLPFPKLVGVEIVPELCSIARDNVNLLLSGQENRIEVRNEDATEIAYPLTPLVLWLYDPFFANILRRVLRELERQLRRQPRETWIVYAANRYEHVLAKFKYLELQADLRLPLSAEDAAVDRHGLTHERVMIYRSNL